jgi:hypothetical protein
MTQQAVSNFYNSAVGKAVQFGSPLSLLPVWNPQWGNNLAEWGVAIVGKLGGLFDSGATPGTNQLTTLSGTRIVGSAPELAAEGGKCVDRQMRIAVGTHITMRPPHKAVRAAFPHTASTLGI